MSSHPDPRAARALADALVAADWRLDDLAARGARALGRERPPRWFLRLAARWLEAFWRARPSPAKGAAWLLDDPGFVRASRRGLVRPATVALQPAPAMSPALGPPSAWPVPALATVAALAGWLEVDLARLDWWADRRGFERDAPAGPLRRYDYRWHPKRDGSSRLIEVPRPGLRHCQRRILHGLLGCIPPHPAAHGFRQGHSVGSFVAPHVGRALVLKLDLRDFFPTVGGARVAALFRTAGYPEDVARTLAGLCTNVAPADLWHRPDAPSRASDAARRSRRLYRDRHLPQGAPTSPALANLAAHRLDARLAGLARASGAAYTRYADDLAFSGDAAWARSADRFRIHAHAIILEEGFEVHPRKTRLLRPGGRQALAGVVVNARPNVARDRFDALKATLHNCATRGVAGQNRAEHPAFRDHLRGRIAHVASLHPARGAKLLALFDRIDWPPPDQQNQAR